MAGYFATPLAKKLGFKDGFRVRVTNAHLESGLPKLMQAIYPDGMIWVSWPKKSSGVPSGLKLVVRKEFRNA